MVLLLAVLLVAAISQCEGQYGNGGGAMFPDSMLARCSLPSIPCRMKMEFRSLATGANEGNSASQTCECGSRTVCSTNWAHPTKVISRQLISNSYNVTMSLMFCRAVTPRRTCTNGEIAVHLSSYMAIPTDLESYNCQCPGSSPLKLRQRRLDYSVFKYHHKYTCPTQTPTCAANGLCQNINGPTTTYPCYCPSTHECRPQGRVWPNTHTMAFYCRPRTS